MEPEARSTPPTVAIIGAGLGGIGTAVKLTQAGITSFTVFEKSEGPGGTWWDNRYPGAECDVPSHLYSFSFKLHDWSRTHAGQGEIQCYVEEVIDEFGLRPHLRLRTAVTRVVWHPQEAAYWLETETGERLRFEVVVSALGLLNVPRYPDWPGLDEFAGPKFHTARWEREHDLTGKRVAVVGAGSSATQVVPQLAPSVEKLVMFQREAPWVVPKNDHDFSDKELAHFRRPLAKRWERARVLWAIDRGYSTIDNEKSARAERERAVVTGHIESAFVDRPDLRAVMTPDYPFKCKRYVVSSNFYPALLRDNVEVVPRGVVSVREHAVVDEAGVEHPIDVLVMATGFQPWNFLASIEVVGDGGRELHGVWGDEPEAFLGLMVPGFPNFFMLYGPNTNGGCVSFTLERQAGFIAKAVARMARQGLDTVEVHATFAYLYKRVLDWRLRRMKAWESNCHNYFHGATGKNVTQWPWTHAAYGFWTWALGRLCMAGKPRKRSPVPE